MMKIEFTTTSAAFMPDNGGSKEYEITRILQKIIDDVENGVEHGPIMDINGNKIGQWVIEE